MNTAACAEVPFQIYIHKKNIMVKLGNCYHSLVVVTPVKYEYE